MLCFLKCYYGYKNLGDELLFFGVLQRIITTYKPTKLIVEVGDIQRWTERIHRHQALIQQIDPDQTCQLQAIQIRTYPKKTIKADLYIFGGGEVMTDQLRFDWKPGKTLRNLVLRCGHQFFARAGWNYLIEYRHAIRQRQVIRIGGIGCPHRWTTALLYQLTLPRAVQIICRDSLSSKIARRYSSQVTQQSDFAIPLILQYQQSIDSSISQTRKSYILINCSYIVPDDDKIQTIQSRIKQYPNHQPLYIAMDRHHDMTGFMTLKDQIHELELYDWTTHDLTHILSMFAHAQAGIGERLHFLLILKTLGVDYTILSPSDKISKVLE